MNALPDAPGWLDPEVRTAWPDHAIRDDGGGYAQTDNP
jgi:hypothetical protein